MSAPRPDHLYKTSIAITFPNRPWAWGRDPSSSVWTSGGCEVCFGGIGGEGRGTIDNSRRLRRAGLKRLVSPYGGNGETMSIFVRALPKHTIFEQNGQNQDFAQIEKRAHVPSKSRFTATEVETGLDYRSLDFSCFGGFEVVLGNLGIAKNKHHWNQK